VQAACGDDGGLCEACLGSPNGTVCRTTLTGGSCGCNATGDCALGSACNQSQHQCTTSCNSNQPCNGGCCLNGICSPGTAVAACGAVGNACLDCSNANTGHACVAGACGCNTTDDCPDNSSCDQTTHQCGNACHARQPCKKGCCTDPVSGTCVTGFAAADCGSDGLVCAVCGSSASGHVCIGGVGGGGCGCNTTADCGPLQACNPSANTCTNACNGSQPCNGGCCSAGQCNAGSGNSTCGANGLACIDCSSSPNGHVCLSGTTCGCTVAGDCPTGQACNTNTHICTSSCGGPNLTACNGGCCQNSTCQNGSVPAACGINGAACTVCGITADTCTAAGACRCGLNNPCAAGQQCVGGVCQCNGTSCPGGCCLSNQCNPSSFATCGLGGIGCTDCSSGITADNCTNGGCRCGLNNPCAAGQQCVSGSCQCNGTSCSTGCCSGNACQPGNAVGACGTMGNGCANCTTITGEICTTGRVCACNTGYKVCGTTCILNGNCCTNSDCSGTPGSVCVSGGCTCPAGSYFCQGANGGTGACIATNRCCTNAQCTVTGQTCSAPNGSCNCPAGQAVCTNNNKCYTPGPGKCCINSDCNTANTSSVSCGFTTNVCSWSCSYPPWVDVDGQWSNGCECADDSWGKTCGAATGLGNIYQGQGTSRSGKLPFTNGENWFQVTFPTPPSNPGNHPVISISSDDSTFRFDVYGSTCGSGAKGCLNEGGSALSRYSWDVFGGGATNGIGCGDTSKFCYSCNCSYPGYIPTPAVGTVLIRVFRPGGAASCLNYTLSVSD
jgi:hypothetical protein